MKDYQSPKITNLTQNNNEAENSSTVAVVVVAVVVVASTCIWMPDIETCETFDCPYSLA